jgi:hypothetical protein
VKQASGNTYEVASFVGAATIPKYQRPKPKTNTIDKKQN